jgi:methionyl-tRNA formyltransferase
LADRYPIVGVVTQPDRPAGRGRALTPPPIKILAQELNLPVIQPHRLRDETALLQLRAWIPDLIVVAAYGQILRSEVLGLPEHGCLNVHASLLPRWRGAAPVQAAILHGDRETGVTIMKMDPGVDTGPILSQCSTTIRPEDTAGSLSSRLAGLGATLLIETLAPYLAGDQPPRTQEGDFTLAPILKKEDGELDFSLPAKYLARQVRAFNPWPGAFTTWQGQRLKVHHAHAAGMDKKVPGLPDEPGKRVIYQDLPAFTTGDGLLALDEVQPAGKRAMSGTTFLLGAREWT